MRCSFVVFVVSVVLAGCAQKDPRLADLTKGISSVCPVHQVQMETRGVTVTVGAPGPVREAAEMSKLAGSLEAFRKEEKALFPFSRTEFYGGDEIDERIPQKALIYVCPECTKAFAAWKSKKEG